MALFFETSYKLNLVIEGQVYQGVFDYPRFDETGRARFVVGDIPFSGRVQKITLDGVFLYDLVGWEPGSISDLVVLSTTTNSIELSFTDAQYATSHEYSLNSGAWTSLASNKIITGLDDDTEYLVRVRGVNSVEEGDPSNEVEANTQALPDTTAPTITSANPSGSYEEGDPVGGTLTADEPVSWSVTGTDASTVTLDAETGVWSLEETDYETKASYSFSFIATDAANNESDPQVVALTITELESG